MSNAYGGMCPFAQTNRLGFGQIKCSCNNSSCQYQENRGGQHVLKERWNNCPRYNANRNRQKDRLPCKPI